MTPKEKAKELVNKFMELTTDWHEIDGFVPNKITAKKCALIAVDEILKVFNVVCGNHPSFDTGIDKTKFYWRRVRDEINKL